VQNNISNGPDFTLNLLFGYGSLFAKFPAFLPHCARWQYLDRLYVGPGYTELIKSPMPLLRYLDLTLGRLTSLALYDAPQLHTVILRSSDSSHAILPWMQLTSLTMQHATPELCFAILGQTPNLVHCCVVDS
jgi:hypothetical protein